MTEKKSSGKESQSSDNTLDNEKSKKSMGGGRKRKLAGKEFHSSEDNTDEEISPEKSKLVDKSESPKIRVPIVIKSKDGDRVYDKRQACYFCGKITVNGFL